MRHIRLLEKRVHQAVERLKQLSEDRRRLEDELRDLRGHLAQIQPDGDGPRDWVGQRAQIENLVRETLSELTGD